METEESLYIKILIWAYEKQDVGFSMEELEEKFNLSPEQKQWVLKVFRSNLPSSENLFDHLSYSGNKNEHLFVITSKGTSAAVEYLNLKEAKRSAKRAEKIALTAIIISVIVGIVQIITAICYRYFFKKTLVLFSQGSYNFYNDKN